MKIIDIIDKHANISLSYEELLMLNAIFNEVCNGIDVFEFETRIGATKEEVSYLLRQIGNILDKMEKN
ncbi:hypothetical protein PT276_10175 [Orbaceae bacterium ESL0721]|nr:hypothetical protein [Orbaceae bacterium ESL0721]MDF7670806.1 hypothetical protein [Orbaceae bacterium ESL0721]MDF7670880.1 hypothetical protein [Orbaceae bacterium ESL0721]MDF7671553.1 hypothetical protein [Orbaceae bacterium ESL0721]